MIVALRELLSLPVLARAKSWALRTADSFADDPAYWHDLIDERTQPGSDKLSMWCQTLPALKFGCFTESACKKTCGWLATSPLASAVWEWRVRVWQAWPKRRKSDFTAVIPVVISLIMLVIMVVTMVSSFCFMVAQVIQLQIPLEAFFECVLDVAVLFISVFLYARWAFEPLTEDRNPCGLESIDVEHSEPQEHFRIG